jgi:predicted metal-dependent peptidase
MNAVLKQSTWDTMTLEQRVRAVNIDIMNHPEFCAVSGFVTMGDIHIEADLPTAGTDGKNIYYGEEFLASLTRKQLRFVQLHEALHIALRHCVDYKDINKKYPQLSNMAQDYVVNAFIEQTDPNHAFVEYTDEPKPLLDPKYFNRSFVDVLQDLLRQAEEGGGGGGGNGAGGQPLDEHRELPKGVDPAEHKKEIEDALNHGDMVRKRVAGKRSANNPLSGLAAKRDTDWRNALREWVQEITAGDEYSRFNPPNKRFMALDILMPSHFDISAGELGILCDTSGSMSGVYPVVFGEIANICNQANPELVRIIWWDSAVCGEQVFRRGEFDNISTLLKPVGGGGTSPQCVVDYIQEKQYKFSGAIWLTDGYLDACPTPACGNELWGVVDNDHFTPAHGKVLRIHS